MMRLRLNAILVLSLLALSLKVMAQARPGWEVYSPWGEGAVVYDFEKQLATATNGVVIKYQNTVLTADTVSWNERSGEAIADGDVRVQRGGETWVSQHLIYNFYTHQLQAGQFRMGQPPAYAGGQGLRGELTNRVYVATNAVVTSDDVANPSVKIRASYIRVEPGRRIVAHNAVVYVMDVPVFYFPYYSRRLGPRANTFNFVPGYRSSFGPFLLADYTWFLNDELDGKLHLDYRERRGVGTGPDLNFHLGRWGDGTLRYYYLHDIDPNVDAAAGASIPQNRERVYFAYQANPLTNFNVKAMVRYQGDTNIIREFFEHEYRDDPQPNTFIEANKFWNNVSLDLYAQPRVNDFLETVESLPEVRLTAFRTQLGNSPFYYESQSSAGYYRRLFPELDSLTLGTNYEAGRVDTYHQITLPHTFFGWLNVAPRVGGRYTYYNGDSGPGQPSEQQSRGVFNTGAEVSFKASQLWPAVHSGVLDLDGVRHIVEPSVNYVYVPAPNLPPRQLPQFDYQLPSLRLLPIDFPDYNDIDSIDSENVMRFGLHNKLQTKRNGAVVNFLDWNLYTDWRIKPRADQTTFSDLYSDLILRPRSWLGLESITRYDPERGQLNLAYHTLTLRPNSTWSWSIGHFYLANDVPDFPGLGNNSLISIFYYRVNENWGFRLYHRFEALTGSLQEQAYSVYRDMRSWTAALTFRTRDNPTGPQDVTVAFTFSLKAYPRYGVYDDMAYGNLLLGP
jgi:LPS-assembly protein